MPKVRSGPQPSARGPGSPIFQGYSRPSAFLPGSPIFQGSSRPSARSLRGPGPDSPIFQGSSRQFCLSCARWLRALRLTPICVVCLPRRSFLDSERLLYDNKPRLWKCKQDCEQGYTCLPFVPETPAWRPAIWQSGLVKSGGYLWPAIWQSGLVPESG